MAFDQHSVNAVGISVNLDGYAELRADILRAPKAVQDEITRMLHAWGDKLYKGARQNLSGDVLQVQTGRLKGALVIHKDALAVEVEDDVFYGAIHEEGNFPWMQPAWDELGGEAGAIKVVQEALDKGLGSVGL